MFIPMPMGVVSIMVLGIITSPGTITTIIPGLLLMDTAFTTIATAVGDSHLESPTDG